MQESNQSTETQTSGGLEPGSSSFETKEKLVKFPDLPDLSGAGFLQAERAEHVPAKKQVILRVDEDILEFFKQQGRRYQTKIHAVLRAYVDRNFTKTQVKINLR